MDHALIKPGYHELLFYSYECDCLQLISVMCLSLTHRHTYKNFTLSLPKYDIILFNLIRLKMLIKLVIITSYYSPLPYTFIPDFPFLFVYY